MPFPGVPPYNDVNLKDWLLHARNTINGCLNGRSNNTGEVTLITSTATTTVEIAVGRLGADSVILFEPTTLNAAGEVGAGTMFVSTKDPSTGKFHITHASNTENDRTFNFIIVG